MSEDFKSVGNLFREKRVGMNLSLKEVENSISVRSGYLEAIEEGSIHQIISGIYAVGFMKQYASFLGLDFDSMVMEDPQAFKTNPERHEFDYGIGTLEVRGSVGGGVKWLPSFLWALASSGILVAAWYLAKYLGVI